MSDADAFQPVSNGSETAVAATIARPAQGFEPTNLDEAMRLAERLAASALIPNALRGKPGDVLVILIAGHEMGLSPLQALRGMHVIEGRPVVSADLMMAQAVRRRDVCAYFRLVRSTDATAEYETLRIGNDEPVKMAFTIEQAKAAGLTGKTTWKAYPAAMLRARCCAALARAVYPDLLFGVYETDEGEEMAQTRRRQPRREPTEVEGSELVKADVERIANAIRAANNKAELDAIIGEAGSLTEQEKVELRPLFKARVCELSKGTAGLRHALKAQMQTDPAPLTETVDADGVVHERQPGEDD